MGILNSRIELGVGVLRAALRVVTEIALTRIIELTIARV